MGIELSAFDEHALPYSKVDARAVYLFQPGGLMPFGKPEEEPLDLDALAVGKQPLKPSRAEGPQAFNEHIDLMETLVTRQLIQHFKQGALGCRQRKWPFGWPRQLPQCVVLQSLRICERFKQNLRAVKPERLFQRKFGKPAGWRLRPVKMDGRWSGRGQIMAEALEVDCCAPAYSQVAPKELLQRNDHLLPAELSERSFVGAARGLNQPTG